MLNGLPDLMYNFSPNQLDAKFILAKNIWKRGEILKEFKTSISLFDEFIVKNGERPEDIATQLYRNPFYNWTILIINDITDYYSQWPRSVKQLQEFVDNKYSQPMGTKYYVTTEVKDDNGNVICPAGKVVPQTFQVAYYNGSTTVTANPTVSVLEERVASIEKSRAAVACSSGHAAQQLAFIPLLNNGDHFISSNKLYGGSINQFSKTFKRFGWNCDFVEPDNLSNFENSIRDNTKFIFIETLSNPDGSIVTRTAVMKRVI